MSNYDGNLNAAIERAKLVENGMQYTIQNAMQLNQPIVENKGEKKQINNEIDELTKQMEKMRINMMKLEKEKNITCYRCGRKGHIAPECNKRVEECTICGKYGHTSEKCFRNRNYNQENRNYNNRNYNQREYDRKERKIEKLNYIDYEEEDEDIDELIDAYIATRSGKTYGNKRREPYKKIKVEKEIKREDESMNIDKKYKVKKTRGKS